MPIIIKDKIIDGRKYTVASFPTEKSITLLARLTELAGPSIAEMEFGLSDSIKRFVEQLGKVPPAALCRELCENVRVDGEPMQGETAFDVWFSGRLGLLKDVIAFVCEVNWNDFLSGIKVVAGGLLLLSERLRKKPSDAESGKDTPAGS